MNIQIKTTGFPSSEAVTEYIEKKVASLERFLEPDTIVHVEVAKTSDHHKHGDIFRAEIRAYAHHRELYVQKETSDLYAAIDGVRDEAQRKLAESKEKSVSFVRRGGAKVKDMLKGIFNK
jgi:ribosomal subunit interface protein